MVETGYNQTELGKIILAACFINDIGTVLALGLIFANYNVYLVLVTKFFGILPLTRYFNFDKREGVYTTLMMSTGLTFGSISALFGLTDHIIDQTQYTILLTAVIGSAVVPTLIAQIWFQPKFEPLQEDARAAPMLVPECKEMAGTRPAILPQPAAKPTQPSG